MTKVIAFRGASSYAPENTRPAIYAAADIGCDTIWLDVGVSQDDTPLIFADHMLERTTNGSGPVSDQSYAQLRALDAGHWFGESFIATPIPTLEDALNIGYERDLSFIFGLPAHVTEDKERIITILDMLSQTWDQSANAIIASASPIALELCSDMLPEFGRALVLGPPVDFEEGKEPPKLPSEIEDLIELSGCGYVVLDPVYANEFAIAQLKRLKVDIYGMAVANDQNRDNAHDVFRHMGVQGIITSKPDEE